MSTHAFDVDDLQLDATFPLVGAQAEIFAVVMAIRLLEPSARLVSKYTGASLTSCHGWTQGTRSPERPIQIMLGWFAWWYLGTLRRWYAQPTTLTAATAWIKRKGFKIHTNWIKRIHATLADVEALLTQHDETVFYSSDYQRAIEIWASLGLIDSINQQRLQEAVYLSDKARTNAIHMILEHAAKIAGI